MDLGSLGSIEFTGAFFLALLTIVLIDLVLAGDNSVVIAMAVRGLPRNRRMQGILLGSLAAVLLRVIFTFFAAKMLLTPFVKLIGGALILWIAIKLMAQEGSHDANKTSASTVWQAVWMILVADFTMSLDNILAVAGASHGNALLLLFGFGLSIPLVVFTSSLLSKLMDRFPIIVWIGAAILGKVGGEMVVTDPLVTERVFAPLRLVQPGGHGAMETHHSVVWGAEILCTVGVIALSVWLRRRRAVRRAASPSVPS